MINGTSTYCLFPRVVVAFHHMPRISQVLNEFPLKDFSRALQFFLSKCWSSISSCQIFEFDRDFWVRFRTFEARKRKFLGSHSWPASLKLTSWSNIRFCFSRFCLVSSIKFSSRLSLLFSPSSCIFFILQASEQRAMFAFSSACLRSFFSWFSCDSKYCRFLRSCDCRSAILKYWEFAPSAYTIANQF